MENLTIKNLGKKLKYFRQRSSFSQMELENRLGLSNGALSRIENGVVNPTKETVSKIISELKLSKLETDYLIGQTSSPATLDEVNNARDHIKKSFGTKGVIAYMVDDRSRVWDASKSFMKLVGMDQLTANQLFGESIIKLLLDKNIRLIKFISTSQIEKVPYDLFVRNLYWEMGFMAEDEAFIISPFIFGILSDFFGYARSFGIVGIATFLVALLLFLLTPKKIRLHQKEIEGLI